MDELEQKKQKLKIDKVIIKNSTSKIHLLLTRPEILEEADKLSEKISNMFEYKPKKPVEQMTNREFRKYKRAQKRRTQGVPQNVDNKKFIIFIICFFSIALIGAIISWIYLGTLTIKPTELFKSQVEVFYNYTEGELSGSKTEVIDLKKFEQNKVDSSLMKQYLTIRFDFKERTKELNLQNLSFKIKTNGRGIATYKINFYNAETNETKQLYYNDDFYFDNSKSYSIKCKTNVKLNSISEGSYIEFVFDEGKTQGLDSLMVYNMLINKQ